MLTAARPDELVQGSGAAWGDPGLALAGVLGLSAEDVRVRERLGTAGRIGGYRQQTQVL